MKKKTFKKNSQKASKNQKPIIYSPLDLHNISSYLEDYAIISKFSHLPFSKREWIETRRYELQFSANKYEHAVGSYLLKNNVKFIHQAPFVINGKIYFLDFFIPSIRAAIEVDGDYHSIDSQYNKDSDRDKNFKTIGIRTYRIQNSEADSRKFLDIKLKVLGIIR